MAQSDHPIRHHTPQARVLLLVRQHGAVTALQMMAAGHYSTKVSGGWVQRVQSLLDRDLVTVIDTQRDAAKTVIGANDKPEHLVLTLTPRAMAELARLDALAATSTPARPAAAAAQGLRAAPRIRTPDFSAPHNPLDRPPVLRAGAEDFARCPSRIGPDIVEYAPHC